MLARRKISLKTALFGAACLYFVVGAIYIPYRGIDRLAQQWSGQPSDLPIFWGAGNIAVSSYKGDLYSRSYAANAVPPKYAVVPGNFFGPPLLALLYAPLSLLAYPTAKIVFVAVSFAGAAGLAGLAYLFSRSLTFTLLAALAVVSFFPVYDSVNVGQPAIIFALLSGAIAYLLVRGHSRPAAVLMGLFALKPSIAIAPAGLILFRGNGRTVAVLGLSVIALVALPFLWVGLGAFADWRALLSSAREFAFTLRGGLTAGAAFMLNWNGFWGRLLRSDPSPLLVAPFYLATLLLVIRVWVRGSAAEGWFAAIVGTLLAIPHLLWYDWLLILPASFALLAEKATAPRVGLLVALHLAVNVNTIQIVEPGFRGAGDFIFVAATPLAFLLLAYLAFEERGEALLGLKRAFLVEEAPAQPA
jgi:hypothetical protein